MAKTPKRTYSEEQMAKIRAKKLAAYHAKKADVTDEEKARRKEYQRLYQAKNRESVAKKAREYQAANKRAIAEQRAEYYRKNKDKLIEDSKKRHFANREAILLKMKERAAGRTKERRDAYNATAREVYAATLEQQRAKSAAYYEANRDKVLERNRKYFAANPHVSVEKYRRRHGIESKATSNWACPYAMASFYDLARALTFLTGVKHEVDHIVPINHKLVCGLHNQFNLQVLTQKENRKKSNKFVF